jgi:transposase
MLPLLDEKQKRIYLATEAKGLGYGGIKAVHEITGVSMTTIIKGKKELQEGNIEQNRIRKSGGGRKKLQKSMAAFRMRLKK